MPLVLPVDAKRRNRAARSSSLEERTSGREREERKAVSLPGKKEEEEGQSGSGNDRPSALEANIDECPALLALLALLALRNQRREERGIALFPSPFPCRRRYPRPDILPAPPCHPFDFSSSANDGDDDDDDDNDAPFSVPWTPDNSIGFERFSQTPRPGVRARSTFSRQLAVNLDPRDKVRRDERASRATRTVVRRSEAGRGGARHDHVFINGP